MRHHSVIALYTDLVNHPDKEFGWEKGLQNALNHDYKEEWIKLIPQKIWKYCAAVGNPFKAGKFNKGDSILDIGCGAGVDLCVASLLVGEQGNVFGVDITPAMVEKAKFNAALAGLSNVTVYQSSIDKLPFADGLMDTVISNGAINLSTCKENVFSEINRVLKKGGHLYFCDMIKDEHNLEESGCETESWADCVAGTLTSGELIHIMEQAGFVDVKFLSTNHYKTSPATMGATFCATKL